jgi:hypothetical protein
MNEHATSQLRLVHALIAARLQEADNQRLVHRPRPGFRRSIGHSMIRIGERLAAEPPLQPARSR